MSAADRAIRVSTAVSVPGVAAIAAYVSYWHARAWRDRGDGTAGAGHDRRPGVGVLDGGPVCGQAPARRPGAGSVAAGPGHRGHAAVAAWSAVSLVGSYEFMLWLIRTAADGGVIRGPAAGQAGGPLVQAPSGLRLVPVEPDGAGEGSVESAAVAAYQASSDIGRPLSERKLAEKFGKTARRWARNRMAEARLQ